MDDPGHLFDASVVYKDSTHGTCSGCDWALADFYSTIQFLITRWLQNISSTSNGHHNGAEKSLCLWSLLPDSLLQWGHGITKACICCMFILFFSCLFMTVTQKLCSILIITIVSKRSISITSTSISVFGPQDTI